MRSLSSRSPSALVPHAQYDDLCPDDLVNNDVGADDQLEGAGHGSHSPKTWVGLKAIDGGNDSDRHSIGGGWIIESYMASERVDVREGGLGEPYFHRGRGSSFLAPQDSSHLRTCW